MVQEEKDLLTNRRILKLIKVDSLFLNGRVGCVEKILLALYENKTSCQLNNTFDTGCENLKEYNGADPWYPPASINYVQYDQPRLPPALNPIAQSLQECRCLIIFTLVAILKE